MKLKKREQETVNNLLRNYADKSYRLNASISLSASFEHDKKLCEVCLFLRHHARTPFYTELRLKGGLRPDVFAPLHVKKFIEILHSESFFDWEKIKGAKYKRLGISKEDIIFIRTDEKVTINSMN